MAPPLSPNASVAVGLAWMPSLCSMDTQLTSLRSPRPPSSSTGNFGTKKSDMPFTPAGAFGVRASTRWDDVVGEIVFAEADEDLLPANAIVIAFGDGAGAQQRQIRPRLRLGQVHGPGPFAGDQPRQILLLLLLGSAQKDRLYRPLGQQRHQGETQIGAVPHLHDGGVDELGQALAAVFRTEAQTVPPGFDELPIGGVEAVGHRHEPVVPSRPFDVAHAIERRPDAAREFRRLLEHGIDQVRRCVLAPGEARDGLEIGEFLDCKLHVPDGSAIRAHSLLLTCADEPVGPRPETGERPARRLAPSTPETCG